MIKKYLNQLRNENLNNIYEKLLNYPELNTKIKVFTLKKKKMEVKNAFHSQKTLFKKVRKYILKKLKKRKGIIKKKINKRKRIRIRLLKKKKQTRKRFFWAGYKKRGRIKYKRSKYKRTLKKRRYKHLKFYNHYLTVNIKRKNTFFSIYRQDFKLIKTPYIIKRQKKKIITYKVAVKQINNLFITKSLGNLKYTGRNKTAPLAREVLGRTAGLAVVYTSCILIEVLLKKKIGRIYKPFFKGLATSKFGLRRILLKKKHPHGFIRPRKKKRK